MELIVDVQGFYIPHFIAKEVAVLSRDGRKLCHYIVKPPVEWKTLDLKSKRNVSWLVHNHHGIAWNKGYVNYDDMRVQLSEILATVSTVFVKGDAKKKFVEEYFNGEVIDLEHKPALKTLKEVKYCYAHASAFVCSLNNVHKIKVILDANDKNEEEFYEDIYNSLNLILL